MLTVFGLTAVSTECTIFVNVDLHHCRKKDLRAIRKSFFFRNTIRRIVFLLGLFSGAAGEGFEVVVVGVVEGDVDFGAGGVVAGGVEQEEAAGAVARSAV